MQTSYCHVTSEAKHKRVTGRGHLSYDPDPGLEPFHLTKVHSSLPHEQNIEFDRWYLNRSH